MHVDDVVLGTHLRDGHNHGEGNEISGRAEGSTQDTLETRPAVGSPKDADLQCLIEVKEFAAPGKSALPEASPPKRLKRNPSGFDLNAMPDDEDDDEAHTDTGGGSLADSAVVPCVPLRRSSVLRNAQASQDLASLPLVDIFPREIMWGPGITGTGLSGLRWGQTQAASDLALVQLQRVLALSTFDTAATLQANRLFRAALLTSQPALGLTTGSTSLLTSSLEALAQSACHLPAANNVGQGDSAEAAALLRYSCLPNA